MLKPLLHISRQLAKSALGIAPYVPSEEVAYQRLRQKGYRPHSLIDVGAYHGNWTRLAHRVFGSTPTLMVEAQPQRSPFLEQTCRDLKQARYTTALLTSRAGDTITFYEMETGSSVMAERSNAARKADQFITSTLDDVAASVDGPVFLKVDVQGAELDVLTGGKQTLAKADLVQLEVAILPYNEGAPSMLDILGFMDINGFQPYDISGMTRPTGNDLAQVDIIFTKNDSNLRPAKFLF